MTETGSSVPRRQLGRFLKQAREEAGVSLDHSARELEWSRARMYRIEAGQVPVRTHDVMAMCSLYGVTDELRNALVSLARESKSKGWWHAYGDVVPAWFELYVGLEAAANRLRHYATAFVPGLLQIEEYAEAIFSVRPDASVETIRQAVALRMERQQLLNRRRPAPPKLEVIIEESVLQRPFPNTRSMANQLRALVADNALSNIDLRVLPSSAWPHDASIAGEFVILDFPSMGTRGAEPTTVYSESLTGALYLDKPREVDAYAGVWRELQERALSAADSDQLLERMIKEAADA